MKKIKLKIVLIVLSVAIFSCQDNKEVLSNINCEENKIALTENELLSISFGDNVELTENEAVDVLKTYLSNNSKTRLSQEFVRAGRIRKNNIIYDKNLQSQMSDVKSNIYIYEIDIDSNGENYMAIVSGDKRFPYVLAYFVRDRKEETIPLSDILPIQYSKEILFNNIKYIDLIEDSLRTSTLEKIAKKLNITTKEIELENIRNSVSLKSNRNTRAVITTNPPSDAIAGNGPFIKVCWNCGMPYNQLMAQNCSENWLWDYRYPISSVVVATAQIMSYFKPSMSIDGTAINWEYLCEKEEIHDTSDYFGSYTKDPDDKCMMIAKLMKYIGDQCGVIYQCNSSSVNFANVISFLNRYGIYVDEAQNMDVTRLKASVDELRPVFMYGQTSSGGGHWWIVDGYRTQVATRGTFFPGFNVYMHANMGQGKSYTGYYLVGSDGSLTFDASFAHFNTNLRMYANVRNFK